MACPTCSGTMQKIAESVFWCPRCGTLSGDGGTVGVTQFWLHTAPKLVERCRNLQAGLVEAEQPEGIEALRLLGISEAIHLPEDRPS